MAARSTYWRDLREYPARLAAAAALACVLGGCNGGVFIDDFLPEVPSVSVEGVEGRTVVPFEADNWGILNVGFLQNELRIYPTDLEGNFQALPFGEGERGCIRLQSDYFDLEVEKGDGRSLGVTLHENLYDNPVAVNLTVGNFYEEKTFSLSAAPTAKYRIDSVAYDWERFSTYDYGLREVDAMALDNTAGSDTLWWTVYPYRNVRREISFFTPGEVRGEEHYARLLGRPLPAIVIPDVEEGEPLLADTRVVFGIKQQELEAGLDPDFAVKVGVPGGKRQHIQVYVAQVHYDVPYTVYCSLPGSGRTRTFSGELRSDLPVAEHYITRTDE